jgi:hypothetical protein
MVIEDASSASLELLTHQFNLLSVERKLKHLQRTLWVTAPPMSL